VAASAIPDAGKNLPGDVVQTGGGSQKSFSTVDSTAVLKEQISHLPTRKHTGRDKQTEVQSCPLSAISAHSQPLLISEP